MFFSTAFFVFLRVLFDFASPVSLHFRTPLFLMTFTVLHTVFYMYPPVILPHLIHYHVLTRNNCCRRSAIRTYICTFTHQKPGLHHHVRA